MVYSEQQKLLIVGASVYQHHIYHTASQLGFEIYAVDQNPNARMLSFADHSRAIDIYDTKKVCEYAREMEIGVVTTVNLDQGMKAVNEIQSQLGLESKRRENIIKSTRKDLMRQTWEDAGVSNPSFEVFEQHEIESAIVYASDSTKPLIVKPVDNAAKRGISILSQDDNRVREKINSAFETSDANRIIIEEYVEGDLYFAPTYVHENGGITVDLISQKVTDELVQIEYTAPPTIWASIREELKTEAKKSAKCFGPGPYHTELIYSEDRGAVLVETSPRISYATIALTRLVQGFDPVFELLNERSPSEIELQPIEYPTADTALLKHVQPQPGTQYVNSGVEEIEEIEYVHEVVPILMPGETVSKFETNDDRVFYFVVSGNDESSSERRSNHVENIILGRFFN